jgi:hypothetical protein
VTISKRATLRESTKYMHAHTVQFGDDDKLDLDLTNRYRWDITLCPIPNMVEEAIWWRFGCNGGCILVSR